jgi:hypothetical protein
MLVSIALSNLDMNSKKVCLGLGHVWAWKMHCPHQFRYHTQNLKIMGHQASFMGYFPLEFLAVNGFHWLVSGRTKTGFRRYHSAHHDEAR